MRVELTNGAWADIRDVSELRDKDRKAVNRTLNLEIDPVTQLPVIPGSMDDDMRDALLRRIIDGWSFENLPLPRDNPGSETEDGSLDLLTIQDARLLHEAIKPHMLLITGQEDPNKPGTVPTES